MLQNPYPESMFPPLTAEENSIVVKAIEATGFTPDRVYGSWGRYVWDTCYRDTLKEVGEYFKRKVEKRDAENFAYNVPHPELGGDIITEEDIDALSQGNMPEKGLLMVTHSDGSKQYYESLPGGGFKEVTKEIERRDK